MSVGLPERPREPRTVVAHLGPTNSGKTHDALSFLAERGRGVFAAPLRMLAQEAHLRLSEELGARHVGLLTGEERINPGAPVLCTTTEMAPLQADTLVLDEVHWATDPQRGAAWTRLLVAGAYEHVRLLGAVDVLPLLRAAYPNLEVRLHERLQPLEWVGEVAFEELNAGTVLVAFSRRSVLWVGAQLAARYGAHRVAVLYGAMPVAARRREIARVVDGSADLIAATDVLGHGVNLPARQVLFCESEKFDGSTRRPLLPWEAAQIAGRAGRFGLSDGGQVGVVTGLRWLCADPRVIRSGLTPLVEVEPGVWGYRRVHAARLRPSLEDLGVREAVELPRALLAWSAAAKPLVAAHPWLSLEPVHELLARLACAAQHIRRGTPGWTAPEAWQLARAPLDPDDEHQAQLLAQLGRCVARGGSLAHLLHEASERTSLVAAERLAITLSTLRWFCHTFPGRGGLDPEAVAWLEEQAAWRVSQALGEHLATNSLGHCLVCAAPCAPWHDLCAGCAGM